MTSDNQGRLGSQDRARHLEECYALAIRSAADYALDFDNKTALADFKKHVTALYLRVNGEQPVGELKSIQASFRGELRDYREKAQNYINNLKADLEGATAAMNTFATTFVTNGADAETKVRGQIRRLEAAAERDDLSELRECVLTATREITRSYDDLNRMNQLVVAELQHEIRLLHKEMESERRAAWSDPESGAWLKRKLDEKIEDLLGTQEAFSVIVIAIVNLKRLEAQCSKTVVHGALNAMVKRSIGVVGDDAMVARLCRDLFATVVELETTSAQAIATELSERLSSRYSVQENGIAQAISMRVFCSVVDRPRDGDAEDFRRRLDQMVGDNPHAPVSEEVPA